jgi:hypothetical protein
MKYTVDDILKRVVVNNTIMERFTLGDKEYIINPTIMTFLKKGIQCSKCNRKVKYVLAEETKNGTAYLRFNGEGGAFKVYDGTVYCQEHKKNRLPKVIDYNEYILDCPKENLVDEMARLMRLNVDTVKYVINKYKSGIDIGNGKLCNYIKANIE